MEHTSLEEGDEVWTQMCAEEGLCQGTWGRQPPADSLLLDIQPQEVRDNCFCRLSHLVYGALLG